MKYIKLFDDYLNEKNILKLPYSKDRKEHLPSIFYRDKDKKGWFADYYSASIYYYIGQPDKEYELKYLPEKTKYIDYSKDNYLYIDKNLGYAGEAAYEIFTKEIREYTKPLIDLYEGNYDIEIRDYIGAFAVIVNKIDYFITNSGDGSDYSYELLDVSNFTKEEITRNFYKFMKVVNFKSILINQKGYTKKEATKYLDNTITTMIKKLYKLKPINLKSIR